MDLDDLPALPNGHDHGGDGYDWMDLAQRTPWVVIPSWGRDGWDLGSWPYVQVLTCAVVVPDARRRPKVPAVCVHCRQALQLLDGQVWASEAGTDCPALANPLPGTEWHPNHRPARQTRLYGVATYCEGDIDVKAFGDHEERIRAIDDVAAFYWRLDGDKPHVPPIGPLGVEYTGPYSPERSQ